MSDYVSKYVLASVNVQVQFDTALTIIQLYNIRDKKHLYDYIQFTYFMQRLSIGWFTCSVILAYQNVKVDQCQWVKHVCMAV